MVEWRSFYLQNSPLNKIDQLKWKDWLAWALEQPGNVGAAISKFPFSSSLHCIEYGAYLAKCKEVEELKSEIEEVISSRPADVCNGWRKERDALQSKVTDLEAKAKRYEAALKYIEGITFDTLSSPRDLIIGMCHTKAVRALKEQAGEDHV
jgi:hypothetical protein